MSEIKTSGNGKKGKAKRLDTRVDFTPMVDMNMLLLTFFMFTTTLSKPQIMNLVLPTKDLEVKDDDSQTKVADSKAITLILGADDQVYYYFGKVTDEMYENPLALQKTNYSAAGLRSMLLDRNRAAADQIRELRYKRYRQEITEKIFEEESSKIKDDPDGQVVIIKPTDQSSYRNLVDALDEMQITSIGKYALVEMTEADNFLLGNYLENVAGGVQSTQ